jgi:Outer membrane protein beta-barrel domain
MKPAMKLLPLWLLLTAVLQTNAQKRLLAGAVGGISSSWMFNSDQDLLTSRASGAYGGLQLDYRITSRLSLNAQLLYQSEKYSSLYAQKEYRDVQFSARRLFAGITEYLPAGNHALYTNIGLTLSHYTANGTVPGNTNTTNLFTETGFRQWHPGWGIQLGYMFRFGLSLQTGFIGDFTKTWTGTFGSLRHNHFQLLQLGYMHGFNKRENMDEWKRQKKRKRRL